MSPPRQYANTGPPRQAEPGRPPEMYGHREELRALEEYNPERPIRVMKYEDQRYMSDRERQERERQEREMELRERELRERERRDMAMAGVEPSRAQGGHPHEYPRQVDPRSQQYGRPPDPRDWTRPGYEPARAPYDPTMHPPRQQEYPPNAAPHYNGPPHPYGPSPADRHHPGPHQHHQHGLPPPGPAHPQTYESPDRQRMGGMHMDRPHPQQQPPPRTREESAVPPPSVAYGGVGPSMYEPSRNRSLEEIGAPHQRNLLGIQEINRKGRISPLPQAVQGAQPQLAGPAGEPGIKSEFGRMFSGIGTGVGTISSPVPAGAQLVYGGTASHRRDDLDVPPEPPVEVAKTAGRGKRRKLKEEDEEGNAGRLTPVGGRAKKPKGHHHHQYVSLFSPLFYVEVLTFPSHHHHHHHHNLEQVSSPALTGNAPFRNIKGSTPVPSPTGLAKDLPGGHHHHHHHHAAPRPQPSAKLAPPLRSPSPVILPKPKQITSSKAVLDSVADRPRMHLGDVIYEPILKRARLQDPRTGRPPRHGYKSTPKPLPWDLIEGKENCTLTMKIGKEHLIPAAREEITSRRALWGTDVYTDDSDVVAACIHAGWIRGEWPDDVDVSLLGLDEGYSVSDVRGLLNNHANGSKSANLPNQQPTSALTVLSEPPKTGPMPVPENRDLHVTVLILPRLQKYASSTRFGIQSREFGGPVGDEDAHQRAVHDGISFMVTGLRWVTNGAAAQNRLRGKARRERIRKALAEVEMTPAWIARPTGPFMEKEAVLGWWKKDASKPPSEGDKENSNRPAPEPEPEPEPRVEGAVEEEGGQEERRRKEISDDEDVKKDVPDGVETDTGPRNDNTGAVEAVEPAPRVGEAVAFTSEEANEMAATVRKVAVEYDETLENGGAGRKPEMAEPELEKTTDA